MIHFLFMELLESTQILETSDKTLPDLNDKVAAVLTIKDEKHNIFYTENSIGRDSSCNIVIVDKTISARHAVIEVEDKDSHFIYDLNSSNKTKLGKTFLKPNVRYLVHDGDELLFANIKAIYTYAKDSNKTADLEDDTTQLICIPETPEKDDSKIIIAETPARKGSPDECEDSDVDLFQESPPPSAIKIQDSTFFNPEDKGRKQGCLSIYDIATQSIIQGEEHEQIEETAYSNIDDTMTEDFAKVGFHKRIDSTRFKEGRSDVPKTNIYMEETEEFAIEKISKKLSLFDESERENEKKLNLINSSRTEQACQNVTNNKETSLSDAKKINEPKVKEEPIENKNSQDCELILSECIEFNNHNIQRKIDNLDISVGSTTSKLHGLSIMDNRNSFEPNDKENSIDDLFIPSQEFPRKDECTEKFQLHMSESFFICTSHEKMVSENNLKSEQLVKGQFKDTPSVFTITVQDEPIQSQNFEIKDRGDDEIRDTKIGEKIPELCEEKSFVNKALVETVISEKKDSFQSNANNTLSQYVNSLIEKDINNVFSEELFQNSQQFCLVKDIIENEAQSTEDIVVETFDNDKLQIGIKSTIKQEVTTKCLKFDDSSLDVFGSQNSAGSQRKVDKFKSDYQEKGSEENTFNVETKKKEVSTASVTEEDTSLEEFEGFEEGIAKINNTNSFRIMSEINNIPFNSISNEQSTIKDQIINELQKENSEECFNGKSNEVHSAQADKSRESMCFEEKEPDLLKNKKGAENHMLEDDKELSLTFSVCSKYDENKREVGKAGLNESKVEEANCPVSDIIDIPKISETEDLNNKNDAIRQSNCFEEETSDSKITENQMLEDEKVLSLPFSVCTKSDENKREVEASLYQSKVEEVNCSISDNIEIPKCSEIEGLNNTNTNEKNEGDEKPIEIKTSIKANDFETSEKSIDKQITDTKKIFDNENVTKLKNSELDGVILDENTIQIQNFDKVTTVESCDEFKNEDENSLDEDFEGFDSCEKQKQRIPTSVLQTTTTNDYFKHYSIMATEYFSQTPRRNICNILTQELICKSRDSDCDDDFDSQILAHETEGIKVDLNELSADPSNVFPSTNTEFKDPFDHVQNKATSFPNKSVVRSNIPENNICTESCVDLKSSGIQELKQPPKNAELKQKLEPSVSVIDDQIINIQDMGKSDCGKKLTVETGIPDLCTEVVNVQDLKNTLKINEPNDLEMSIYDMSTQFEDFQCLQKSDEDTKVVEECKVSNSNSCTQPANLHKTKPINEINTEVTTSSNTKEVNVHPLEKLSGNMNVFDLESSVYNVCTQPFEIELLKTSTYDLQTELVSAQILMKSSENRNVSDDLETSMSKLCAQPVNIQSLRKSPSLDTKPVDDLEASISNLCTQPVNLQSLENSGIKPVDDLEASISNPSTQPVNLQNLKKLPSHDTKPVDDLEASISNLCTQPVNLQNLKKLSSYDTKPVDDLEASISNLYTQPVNLQNLKKLSSHDTKPVDDLEASISNLCTQPVNLQNLKKLSSLDTKPFDDLEASISNICTQPVNLQNVKKLSSHNTKPVDDLEASISNLCTQPVNLQNVKKLSSHNTKPVDDLEASISNLCTQPVNLQNLKKSSAQDMKIIDDLEASISNLSTQPVNLQNLKKLSSDNMHAFDVLEVSISDICTQPVNIENLIKTNLKTRTDNKNDLDSEFANTQNSEKSFGNMKVSDHLEASISSMSTQPVNLQNLRKSSENKKVCNNMENTTISDLCTQPENIQTLQITSKNKTVSDVLDVSISNICTQPVNLQNLKKLSDKVQSNEKADISDMSVQFVNQQSSPKITKIFETTISDMCTAEMVNHVISRANHFYTSTPKPVHNIQLRDKKCNKAIAEQRDDSVETCKLPAVEKHFNVKTNCKNSSREKLLDVKLELNKMGENCNGPSVLINVPVQRTTNNSIKKFDPDMDEDSDVIESRKTKVYNLSSDSEDDSPLSFIPSKRPKLFLNNEDEGEEKNKVKRTNDYNDIKTMDELHGAPISFFKKKKTFQIEIKQESVSPGKNISSYRTVSMEETNPVHCNTSLEGTVCSMEETLISTKPVCQKTFKKFTRKQFPLTKIQEECSDSLKGIESNDNVVDKDLGRGKRSRVLKNFSDFETEQSLKVIPADKSSVCLPLPKKRKLETAKETTDISSSSSGIKQMELIVEKPKKRSAKKEKTDLTNENAKTDKVSLKSTLPEIVCTQDLVKNNSLKKTEENDVSLNKSSPKGKVFKKNKILKQNATSSVDTQNKHPGNVLDDVKAENSSKENLNKCSADSQSLNKRGRNIRKKPEVKEAINVEQVNVNEHEKMQIEDLPLGRSLRSKRTQPENKNLPEKKVKNIRNLKQKKPDSEEVLNQKPLGSSTSSLNIEHSKKNEEVKCNKRTKKGISKKETKKVTNNSAETAYLAGSTTGSSENHTSLDLEQHNFATAKKSPKNNKKTRKIKNADPSISSGSTQTSLSKTFDEPFRIMFAGYSDPTMLALIERLNGEVVENALTCTIVVADKVKKTTKFLCGLALGRPIVPPKWLQGCEDSDYFIDPFKHILLDNETEEKYSFHLSESINKAKHSKLLESWSVYATPSTKPPPIEIKSIIECSGGKFLQKEPARWPKNSFVISCIEDKEKWAKLKKRGTIPPIVSTEVLLTGVLQQTLDLTSHALKL
ncbi:uncharacterized protein LOC106661444 [Cimex lectularius]|uniref:Mediator of DNA damage checkpoint protein 1 n=1 Tax=Cimex lectularius TaxID=79782 RepID=A0A8I6RDA6_CIMLE|nr:uncharacterized protein LOC106661444 [Cimex lectularius]